MKISVIVPVKNGEDVIERSVMSVLQQSCSDIELICIDDCSTDATYDILEKIQKADARLQLIHYDETRGALRARKDGVNKASGEYIMFLDADDYLAVKACEKLYCLAQSKKTDILHFSAQVDDCGAGAERTNKMKKFVAPCICRLQGDAVFEECFVHNRYKFNLWNKIIRTEVCKEAFEHLEDGYFPKANDLYAYFMIALYAKSYIGIRTDIFYYYQFGKGSTGSNNMSYSQFATYCKESYVVDALERFFESHKEFSRYKACVQSIKTKFSKECLWNWREHLNQDDTKNGFDELVRTWGMPEIASDIAEKYHTICGEIAQSIVGVDVLKAVNRTIRTIGIFYFRMAKGGVQRVISLQIPMFIKLGYHVVLFTDECDPDKEFEIPSEVERVILPNSFRIATSEYRQRALKLNEQIREKQIDVMLYHAGTSPMLFYDMLITKAQGIPFVVTVHELFSQGMVKLSPWQRQRVGVYRLLDRLIVLSRVEQTYWTTLGISAEYVPNPIQDSQQRCKEGGYILWIGRFEKEQKQYGEAIHIMNLVVQSVPNAKMKMVGNEVTPNARKDIDKLIAKYGLQDNVEVIDFQKDVQSLYEGAKVQLITSAYESFPMTIIESKSYAVPLVLYDMPYLELLQDKKGYRSVMQGDRKMAARELTVILKNDDVYHELSVAAAESIQPFREYDLAGHWNRILQQICDENIDKKNCSNQDQAMRMILETMLFHYEKGAKRYKNTVAKYNKLCSSKAYKLGNRLLKYPHKIYYWIKKRRK